MKWKAESLGWYDALNGLPGLLGSSMAETYETYRMVCWLLSAIDEFDQSVDMPAEVDALARALALACNCHMEEMDSDGQAYGLWTDLNDAKEAFWEKTAKTISGTYVSWNKEMQKTLLGLFEVVLRKGIEKAQRIGGPVCPTYFYYEVTQYEKIEQGLMPCPVPGTPDAGFS